jgi:hypothetical protein
MNPRSVLTATGLAVLLVLGTDYLTFAATGDSLLLGKSNKADQTTSVTNTGGGPVLTLRSTHAGSQPPLKVNSAVKVAKLNADLVDGKGAGQLGVRSLVYRKAFGLTGVAGFTITLPNVPAGTYLGAWSGWVYGPASATHECFINVGDPSRLALDHWDPGNEDGFLALTNAGVVRVGSTQDLQATCLGDTGDYSTASGAPIEILLTRVDKVTAKSSTVGRSVAPRHVASR